MKKVFIVQGEHPYVGGRSMSAHSSKKSAQIEAVSLTNLILKDFDMEPLKPTAKKRDVDRALARVNKDRAPEDQGDVWITELPIQDLTPPGKVMHDLKAGE